jgi:hypothetical protein
MKTEAGLGVDAADFAQDASFRPDQQQWNPRRTHCEGSRRLFAKIEVGTRLNTIADTRRWRTVTKRFSDAV